MQTFHKGLVRALRKEHRESKERLEAERALIDDGIADVESELDAVGALKGIPRTILDEYSHLDRELGRLIDANDFHDELKDLDEEAGPIEADRRATVESAIESLGMTLNSDLADLNARVCGEAMSAPTIVLHSGTKNQYGIGNNVLYVCRERHDRVGIRALLIRILEDIERDIPRQNGVSVEQEPVRPRPRHTKRSPIGRLHDHILQAPSDKRFYLIGQKLIILCINRYAQVS